MSRFERKVMITTKSYPFSKLPEKYRKFIMDNKMYLDEHSCGFLTFSKTGLMHKNSRVFLLFSDKEIIGWSLLLHYYSTTWVHVFVSQNYRKNGYGRLLFEEASKKDKRVNRLVGSLHDSLSHDFFKKMRSVSHNLTLEDLR